MIEFVGYCVTYHKAVYCENGFLRGEHHNNELYCERCFNHNLT
ncbi:hypothetical protein ABID56_000026 [Alkalibacillus flavidus]|uniref:Uncharacterized protein n=1 Tax=Alkalibacillus flavidus TaxID=546021 RepID=A0ABV2KS43_9BACI